MDITQQPDPCVYGKTNGHRDSSTPYAIANASVEVCARSGLQILHIQDIILKFLVRCRRSILHDMSEESLERSQLQPEPPLSELLNADGVDHTSFSDILSIAPYRD
jgi:hypothetical protein